MYLHLGQETVVRERDIIGIFDLDNTTVSLSLIHISEPTRPY